MAKTRGIVVLTALLVLPLSVATAESGPNYVDYAQARARISSLDEEAVSLQQEIEAMRQENKDLEKSIREWKRELAQIKELIRKTRNRKTDLYLSRRGIVDSEMQSEAQSLLEESVSLVEELEDAEKQREQSIEEAIATIDRNETRITVHRAVVTRNREQITVLEESVEKTQGQTEFIQDVKADLKQYREEASKFL